MTIGPTGEFPDGQLGPDDGGELNVGVTVRDNQLVILFGTHVDWVGMPKETAIEFAQLIIKRANEMD